MSFFFSFFLSPSCHSFILFFNSVTEQSNLQLLSRASSQRHFFSPFSPQCWSHLASIKLLTGRSRGTHFATNRRRRIAIKWLQCVPSRCHSCLSKGKPNISCKDSIKTAAFARPQGCTGSGHTFNSSTCDYTSADRNAIDGRIALHDHSICRRVSISSKPCNNSATWCWIICWGMRGHPSLSWKTNFHAGYYSHQFNTRNVSSNGEAWDRWRTSMKCKASNNVFII